MDIFTKANLLLKIEQLMKQGYSYTQAKEIAEKKNEKGK